MSPMRVFLVATALLSPLSAQRTWIVDPRGGGHFPDLAPAVAASSPGDTLILRHGPFNGTVIDKGIRIVTDMTGAIGIRGLLTIRSIPASDTMVLTAVQGTVLDEPQFSLLIEKCAGQVHVGSTYFPPTGDPIRTRSRVDVVDSAHVTFCGCRLVDVAVTRSSVAFTLCGLQGDGWPRSTHSMAFPGLTSVDADVVMTQCIVVGGRLHGTTGLVPGIHMQGGRLVVTGDPYLPKFGHWRSIAGGYRRDPNGVAHDGPAIHSDGGVVEMDPRVTLATFTGNAPLSTGSSTFVTRAIPIITTNEGNPRIGGDHLIARIHGPADAQGFVFLSKPHPPTTVPGLGQLWVDPQNLIF